MVLKNKDFCHLHLHNEYSQLDGLGKASSYAERAAKIGFKHLGISNHGNIDGVIDFQKKCLEKNIHPVIGCEMYVVPDAEKKNRGERRGHICAFVKNDVGWRNLCRLVSYSNVTGFYYRPRVGFEQILKYKKGLIFTTACVESFLSFEEGKELFTALLNRHKENFYLEVMPHNYEKQVEHNQRCLKLASKHGLPLVATNDCHYVGEKDFRVQDVLLAIQTKAKMSDKGRYHFRWRGFYLRSAKEMMEEFESQQALSRKHYLQAMLNSVEIAERCKFKIEKKQFSLPSLPDVTDEDKKLESLCIKGFDKIFNGNRPIKYWKRFKQEFDLIVRKKFSRYFLIVWDLMRFCKDNDIMVGPGRGSVGGSLIAYLLGITKVDPIKFDLLFSRFIAEDRIDYPDIDMDFEDRRRMDVRKYLEEKYGEMNVFGVSNFTHMKSRLVVKDVARAFDVPVKEVDEFTKTIVESDDADIGNIESATREDIGLNFKNRYPKVIKYSQKLEGQIRGYGQHAAAVIITDGDLLKEGRGAIVGGKKGANVCWSMNDCEYMGLVKLDVLGLNTLSVINETRKLIEQNHGKKIVFEKLNLEDRAVLRFINDCNTVGLFQLGTYSMTRLIEKMGVDKFMDLSDAVALVRPGPSASGMTDDYILRKHGKRWKKKHPIYEEITKDTFGIIVYQEQVMEVFYKVAGLPYSEADKIRKIIGKKRDVKEFEPYRIGFIKGCLKQKTLDKKEANEFWAALQSHAHYSFNKSHSVEYAMIGYWTAWLKHYFPTEFICAQLTYGTDSEDKKSALIEDAKKMGLNLYPPKIGISHATKWVAGDKKLFVPFIEVKGIGEKTVEDIVGAKPKSNGFRGFFECETPNCAQVVTKGKIGKILERLKAYDMSAFPDGDISDLLPYKFDFNSNNDYPRLYRYFGDMTISNIGLTNILEGNFDKEELRRPLVYKRSIENSKECLRCNGCKLRKEATKPVPPSPGKYNVMIIGEAPGRDEDRLGYGFAGRSGNLLWKIIGKFGFLRKDFHVTNNCKCFPFVTRTPKPEHIKTCAGKWLEQEIRELKPKIMLAFGNTSLKFFLDKDSGITGKSGKIEWNDKYSAYICWCVHPAFVLRNREENLDLFKRSIKKFCEFVRKQI